MLRMDVNRYIMVGAPRSHLHQCEWRVDGNGYSIAGWRKPLQHCRRTETVTVLRVDRNRYIIPGEREPFQHCGWTETSDRITFLSICVLTVAIIVYAQHIYVATASGLGTRVSWVIQPKKNLKKPSCQPLGWAICNTLRNWVSTTCYYMNRTSNSQTPNTKWNREQKTYHRLLVNVWSRLVCNIKAKSRPSLTPPETGF